MTTINKPDIKENQMFHKRYEKPVGHGNQITVKEFIQSAWGGPCAETGDYYVVKNHAPNPRNLYSAKVKGHWRTVQLSKAEATKWAEKTSEWVRLRRWQRKENLVDVQEQLTAGTISIDDAKHVIQLNS